MRIRYWCNSGENAYSCYEGVVTLDDLNMTKSEWYEMTEEEREEVMRPIAQERLDWGFTVLED